MDACERPVPPPQRHQGPCGHRATSYRRPPEPAQRRARPLGAPEARCLLSPAATAAVRRELLSRSSPDSSLTAPHLRPAAAPARPSQPRNQSAGLGHRGEAGNGSSPGLSAPLAGPRLPEDFVFVSHAPYGLFRVLFHKNLARNHFQLPGHGGENPALPSWARARCFLPCVPCPALPFP